MEKDSSLRWLILLTVIVGTFLGRLDQTIVNLALPKIIDDFSITISAAGWIATAYILANAVFVPIWGKLGDTIGRKRVYLIGFSIFILGSVLAGLSWNLGSLIVFRIVQAIASSADYPTAMSIIAFTFTDGRERAQALGLWSSSFAAASVFGPLLGGPLIDSFGWRSVFLVNLPVGLVGAFMALAFIPESRAEQKGKRIFDWWGAITLGGGLAFLTLVLDQGTDWGWMSLNSFLCYLAIALSSFVFSRVERAHPEPIVDLKFFKNSVFVHTLLNNFVMFMGMIGSVFLIPIFAQTFLGYTATESGYLFMPMAFALLIAAPVGGRLTGKVQARYVIAASTFVGGIGLFLFSFLDARSTAFDIVLPLAIMAFGMGFGMAQRTNIIAQVIPKDEIGIASSILALVRNIAGAFGIAIFGTILQSQTESNVLSISKYSSLFLKTPALSKEYIGLIALKAQIEAYSFIFVLASAIVLLGAFGSFAIKVEEETSVSAEPILMEG